MATRPVRRRDEGRQNSDDQEDRFNRDVDYRVENSRTGGATRRETDEDEGLPNNCNSNRDKGINPALNFFLRENNMEEERDKYVNEHDWPRLPQRGQQHRQAQGVRREYQPATNNQQDREEPHQGPPAKTTMTSRNSTAHKKGDVDYSLPPPLNTSRDRRQKYPGQTKQPGVNRDHQQRRTDENEQPNEDDMNGQLRARQEEKRRDSNKRNTHNNRNNSNEVGQSQNKNGKERVTKTINEKSGTQEEDWWISSSGKAQNVQFGFFSENAGKSRKEKKEESIEEEESIYY